MKQILENLSSKNPEDFPLTLYLNNEKYFIVKQPDNQFILLSALCPHQGGTIELDSLGKKEFVCPVHKWKFDINGKCLNVRSRKLESFPLQKQNDALYLDATFLEAKELPTQPHLVTTSSSINKDIEIKLHAHACVEIVADDFSILTDPWLVGPAFMGSWIQYPIHHVNLATLNPTVICITHEHSDHFHIQTLKHFDKNTPIYFPAFPNQRMEKILHTLGFKQLYPIKFGEKIELPNKKGFLCPYEPVSIWNDAIMHLEINGFNIVNYNDAGLNYAIKKYLPPKIDLLMGQFSHGASGYPLTWKNMNEEEKFNFYRTAGQGVLELMEKAYDFYNTEAFLPFASFFMLWHPSHKKYRQNLSLNTLPMVEEKLSAKGKNIIGLMPGESYSYSKGIQKIYSEEARRALYTPENIEKNIHSAFNLKEFEEFHYESFSITLPELLDYFNQFNDIPELCHCEDIKVNFFITQDSTHQKNQYSFSIAIQEHTLTVHEQTVTDSHLNCWIPLNLIAAIVHENLSWDELHIGYWCKFERLTQQYEVSFWRLLQTPYYKKSLYSSTTGSDSKEATPIDLQTPVLSVIENIPNGERILARYGLYCQTCDKAYKETLETATLYHGLPPFRKQELVTELNTLLIKD